MGKMEQSVEWDLVIKSQSKMFDLKLGDVWRYRDLLALLVRRDFVAFYKQTILGPIWFFIQPIFTTAVYIFLFSSLAGISTDGLPAPIFYLTGITAWGYFSESLTKTANVFRENANIFGKVYFPRLIMPLSIILSSLIKFAVQLFLLLLVVIFYMVQGESFTLSPYILLFPFLLVLMACQGLGLGMIISALTTKYRDLALLLTFGIQLFMYATPVVYPLSSLQGTFRFVISLNPMTHIIEGMRLGFFGAGTFDLWSLLYTTIVTLILLLTGTFIFNRVEKNFVDTV